MGPAQGIHGSERAGAPRREFSGSSLFVNLFPANLSSEMVAVAVGRWKDPESAAQLRDERPGLRTWRDPLDGTRLYAWFADGRTEVPAGFREVTVRLDEAPGIFKRMLMDAVERRFIRLGFQKKGNGFVNYSKPSLLAHVPMLEAAAKEPIGVYAKIIPRIHYTWDAAGDVLIGAAIDVLYTTRLDLPVAEWVAAGLRNDLDGSYVVLLPNTPEATSYPRLVGRSIGRIEEIRGAAVLLGDRQDPALSEVRASSVAPEPTRVNLARYLAARHSRAWEDGETALRQKIDQLVRPRRRHELATKAVERINGDQPSGLDVYGALQVRFEDMVRVGGREFPVTRLQEPTYSFDSASDRRVAKRVDTGLKDFGPFDQHQKRGQAFKILVVALQENLREVEVGIRKLEAGIQTPEAVFGGLRSMYRLSNLEVVYAFAPRSTAPPMVRYADAARDAINTAPQRDGGRSRFDLVVAVIKEQFRTLADSENPYFQTKALALVLDGVPTQAVTIEKLRQGDKNLQYILNTMALACYAKVGGTSHVLKVNDGDERVTELVFGVGRAMVGDRRHGPGREETIGFATVFRANGEYLYNDCTPYCDRDHYERALEHTILRTVDRVAGFEELKEGSRLRLIFHVPRRPGRHEERAVLNAVGKLPRFKVDFALLHVNDDHQFQVFDTRNTLPRGRKGEKPEAALMTQRGLCVALGPDERLVTFVGPDQYRGYGSPGPALLRLDHRSTLRDIDYLAQQLYLLSFMNVGSLNPGVAPASIAYAEKLAHLTGHLRGVQQWTVDLINQKLGRKLWFV